MKHRVLVKSILVLILVSIWFYWDFSQAGKQLISKYPSFKSAKEFNAITSATTKVSIVRSDDSGLMQPISITSDKIEYAQIEEMVRRAIELAGGFSWVITPGDMVLIKPNIVNHELPKMGEITDVRVVKALIKIVDEIDPGNMDIVVGEGSPRPMDYEMAYQSKFGSPCWDKLWDVAGYQDLLADPDLSGIKFRFSNLNGSPEDDPWQDLVEVEVPGGGQAQPQEGKYYIHKDILNADVFITVPVMKIHEPGVTVALKNQIGIAPSTMYGFSKTEGVPQDGYKHCLIHGAETPKWWTDKEIVDLCNLAQIKFVVVDAIACLERQKSIIERDEVITNLVRMNTIVAGADPVAVDHVCSRLMGINPDDIEHITLAERVGLGTNDPENIHIVGADIETTKKRFIKSTAASGDYGQSNRIWLLSGPFDIDGISEPIDHEFIANEAGIAASEGKENWSEPIYFTDDRIDLRDYYDLKSGATAVSYAFSYFDAPKDQEAELWIGSDEALKIYINGNEVYRYSGTRSFSDSKFYLVKVTAPIKAGENRLLVKSLQKYGRYDFSLNICEPESNSDFDGNRIWGLKFKTESTGTSVDSSEPAKTPISFIVENAWPNPFNSAVKVQYQIPSASVMNIAVFNIQGQKIRTLQTGRVVSAGEYQVVWDGLSDAGVAVSSGMYFITFSDALNATISQKVLYVR